jgi:hypothetical protein
MKNIVCYIHNSGYPTVLQWGELPEVQESKLFFDSREGRKLFKDFDIDITDVHIIIKIKTDQPIVVEQKLRFFFKNNIEDITIEDTLQVDLKNEYYKNGYICLEDILGERSTDISRGDFHKTIKEIVTEPCHFIELGVMNGDSLSTFYKLFEDENNEFIGFDTFEGLDKKWVTFNDGWEVVRDYNMMKVSKIPDSIQSDNYKLVKGYIQDTLKDNLPNTTKRWMIHFDMDLYDSTLYGLFTIHHFLKEGDFILFDEFDDLDHEFKAWNDYIMATRTKHKWQLVLANKSQYLFKILACTQSAA